MLDFVQVEPFQCWKSRLTAPFDAAQASEGVLAQIAFAGSTPHAGGGGVITFQAPPSQCAITPPRPTAHASPAELCHSAR